jgi:hypothetical protein
VPFSVAIRRLAIVFVFSTVAALGACEGCRPPPGKVGGADSMANRAAARLYVVSDLAGALEPCGCVKDQLGGLDHFGALVTADKNAASGSAVLAAGPLFFMDMQLEGDRRAQEVAKAETLASGLKSLGLAAFAPGRNDWAAGDTALQKLTDGSGAALLGGNVTSAEVKPAPWVVRTIGELKLGIIGVAAPDRFSSSTLQPPPAIAGLASTPASEAVKSALDAVRGQGVDAVVVVAAVGRGEAKRIADANPDLLAIVVGSNGGGGDSNTETPPAERVGDVLIIETGNHLQTVGVLDLFPRAKGATKGLLKFADGTGIERTKKREDLEKRIRELRARVATWALDKHVATSDIDARKADIARLEAERDALDHAPAPAEGSYYRYAAREIRDTLGADDAVKGHILAYYKRVNDSNKVEFASRKAATPAKGTPGYVGIETCGACHEGARSVWDKTAHANAYPTLVKAFKEFNLDCVSCHVTGYDRPGGSTVTHVEGLANVQCEVCHGPGSLHAASPASVRVPVVKPGPSVCEGCHHPPHVHTFDAAAKMSEILGPGHGGKK